jgi:Ala-tRNA(Pro) deacylase
VRPRSIDEFLKNAHVPFTTFQHAAAFSAQKEAALSHVPGRSWAKTVICFADDEPIAAVVPAHVTVDLERLRMMAGAVIVRLACEPELAAIFPDCELGAVSPFSRERKLRTFVDCSFVGDPDMVFSAGTHTDAIRMHYGDFADLTNAVVGSLGTTAASQTRPAGAIDVLVDESNRSPREPVSRGGGRPSRRLDRPAV